MSRASTSGSRHLSLTEELEKLEQSITLTLQEIDHNFSKAHRIVTTSILPVVEQYAEHSRNVWDGSKFWKQFFEASANVSLSGYEEAALEADTSHADTTATHDTTFETPSAQGGHDSIIEVEDEQYDSEGDGPSLIDSPSNATGVHSTPHLPASTAKASRIRSTQRSLASPPPPKSSAHRLAYRQPPTPDEPSTPRPHHANPLRATDSSPFEPPSAYQVSTAQRAQNPDPLLHRVLDRNYRVQATPHTAQRALSARTAAAAAPTSKATPATATRQGPLFADSSPLSSPEISAPQLRSDLFSPAPRPPPSATRRRTQAAAAVAAPRTPGISLQTPGRRLTTTTTTLAGRNEDDTRTRTTALWDSSSDDDDQDAEGGVLGMSPPKTMQFHVPASRLLQTPAKEASRRIVQDLLATAGADATDEIEGFGAEGAGVGEEEVSPSLVQRQWDSDDTF